MSFEKKLMLTGKKNISEQFGLQHPTMRDYSQVESIEAISQRVDIPVPVNVSPAHIYITRASSQTIQD